MLISSFMILSIFVQIIRCEKEAYFVPRNVSQISNEFAAKDVISIVSKDSNYITTVENNQKDIFLTIATTEELNFNILFNETIASINKCSDVVSTTLSYTCKDDGQHHWIMFEWYWPKMTLTVTKGTSDPSQISSTHINIDQGKDFFDREISLVEVYDLNLPKIRLVSIANAEELAICPIKLDRSGSVEDHFTVSSKDYMLADIEISNLNPGCGMSLQFSRDWCCVLAIPKSLQFSTTATTSRSILDSSEEVKKESSNGEASETGKEEAKVSSSKEEAKDGSSPTTEDVSSAGWKIIIAVLVCLFFVMVLIWWAKEKRKNRYLRHHQDVRYTSVRQ